MAAPLRSVARSLSRVVQLFPGLLAALMAMPLLWIGVVAVAEGLNLSAWQALASEPQLPQALLMTLWTGLVATTLSVACAAWLLSRNFPGPLWQRTVKTLSPLLAVPHAAFAIGFAFLISPSGALLRVFSPWATGWDTPPPWPTTQDPWGFGLMAVLVAKEVPFLLWTAATQLQRADVGPRLSRELDVAHSLGYTPRTAWWRVLWPQLCPRLTVPALAVLAYSLTVVDMAVVMGPTSPPTLALLAWQWLVDADPAVNAQGAAAAWLLALTVGGVAGGLWGVSRAVQRRRPGVDGQRGNKHKRVQGGSGVPGLTVLYGAVMLGLAVGSVAGVWPFPQLWPSALSLQAWQSVVSSTDTLGITLLLGLCSSATALVWAVAWLEWGAPALPALDRLMRRLIYLPLLLPSVLWVVGLHRLSLAWGVDATLAGLWLAHTLAATPYVLIALSPAYQGFDVRYGQMTASLCRSRWAFLTQVKWPLLKSALGAALAVGFAVSVAQYLPTLFIGAGRFTTVTTEAVTLASGAQRSLTAAYAWLQWLLPALVFGVAAWAGRPRCFRPVGL